MYESTFQLSRRPFVAMPSSDQYFPAQSIENARTAIVRLVDRYEGPAMVIGPVGTGKSLLSQVLADYFRPHFRVALIPSGRICTRRTLLQVLLHELGLAYQGMEEGELRLSLIDHLTSADFCPNGTLLMIDESDSLPMALLDELRSMTNLVANEKPCIRLVLFGSPRLEEKFGHPRLESFNQRLAGRFYLEPLNRNETLEYIVTQFDECGGDSSLTFSNESLEAIYRATNGVPRMINQLADHALILATSNGQKFIDQDLVNAAWSDLQQLPAPTPISLGPSIGADHVIEFGELDAIDASEPHDFATDRLPDETSVPDAMATIDEMQQQLAELETDDASGDDASGDESPDDDTSIDAISDNDIADSDISDNDISVQDATDHDSSEQESEADALPVEVAEQIEEPSIHLHEAFDPFSDSFAEEEEIVVNHISAA
ncbi:AAA family ATPase, partial [Planctomycetota bacterium]